MLHHRTVGESLEYNKINLTLTLIFILQLFFIIKFVFYHDFYSFIIFTAYLRFFCYEEEMSVTLYAKEVLYLR